MSWTRSTQPKFSNFGALDGFPAAFVDRLAMSAVECGSACAVRVLLHLRTFDRSAS